MSSRSSSSRRSSSQASGTYRIPKWSTASFHSSQTTTSSVSRVFAQPLQSSPLRSAIDQLPAIGDFEDSRSTYSEAEVASKRRRAVSIASGGDLGSQDTLAEDEVGARKQLESEDERAQAVQILHPSEIVISRDTPQPQPAIENLPEHSETAAIAGIETLSARAPAQTIPEIATVQEPRATTSPARSSWFASLTRARGNSSAVVPSAPDRTTTPVSVDMFKAPIPSSPQPAAESTSASSTSPVAGPSLLTSEAQGSDMKWSNGPQSAVPSIDDEVPAFEASREAQYALTKQDDDARVVTRRASATALNPSSSRFMLRIPLLGRPKTPLEDVMAHTGDASSKPTAADKPAETPEIPAVIVSGPSSESIAHQASQPEDAPRSEVVESGASSFPQEAEKDDSAAVGNVSNLPASSSSWWSYIGWAGSSSTANVSGEDQTADSAPAPSSELQPDSEAAVSAPAEHVDPLPDESTASPTPCKETSVPVPDNGDSENAKQIGEGSQQQTPSLFSAETQGSAWYSPWSWYAASPIAPSSSTALASTPQADSRDNIAQTDPEMTASEMVKEEALARDAEKVNDAVTVGDSSPEAEDSSGDTPKATPSSPLINPIESSISTNKSGWASFFMSKALLVKTITDGQEAKAHDQDGMEVMDIDEDEDQGTGGDTPAPVVPAVLPTKAMTVVVGKPSDILPSPRSVSASPNLRESVKPPTQEREPKKCGPPAPPLTNSESIKKETAKVAAIGTRSPSPTPSKTSVTSPRAAPPNLVLPTWHDTFCTAPRSLAPPSPPTPPATQKSTIGKTLDFFSGVIFSGSDEKHGKASLKGKGKERERDVLHTHFGAELPKALDVGGQGFDPSILNDKCRVVVIGVAGWNPGAVTRTLAGGLPSSSSKFVSMTCTALEQFEEEHNFKFKKITKIPLEGDGTIERKVEKVHSHLLGEAAWMEDLHSADVIFVAAHSQGCIVSTHLLDRLIREGHILTPRNVEIVASTAATVAPGGVAPVAPTSSRSQRICCLALCGIHLGPLRYLKTSSLLQPYIQYFENAAARELFEFQDTESDVSKQYAKALNTVMDHGTKMVYVASLNDQVVPIYSGLFTAVSHPRILRALYIDGDAYHSSDFLSNLLVLLIRIMNSGLSDSGLLAHLSEATAGTLSGVGHSTAYEELATYSLAVKYLFLTTDGPDIRKEVAVEPFNAVNEQNDYEIPWSLRDLIADDRVAHFFASEFSQLKDAFDHWAPKTTILRDVKRKLQPIQRLSSIRGSTFGSRL